MCPYIEYCTDYQIRTVWTETSRTQSGATLMIAIGEGTHKDNRDLGCHLGRIRGGTEVSERWYQRGLGRSIQLSMEQQKE